MKKIYLYLLVIFLFAFTPIGIMAGLGKMLDMKYSVEDNYHHIESDREIPESEKKLLLSNLDSQHSNLMIQAIFFFLGAILTFVGGIFILANKRKMLQW